jgi:hypothetical protein
MLALTFLRANFLYCLLVVGGLCLLLSGNLLQSLGVGEIFRDSPDEHLSIWASRSFAAQFYSALFVSIVFVCHVASYDNRVLPGINCERTQASRV